MRYRFITILHNLKLTSAHNRGIQLYRGTRVTNGNDILKETLDNDLMKYTIGIHSIDEFDGQVYCYSDGVFENIKEDKQMDLYGTKYTFYFLRELQMFINQLWELKDNNVYVRDGYLICYKDNIVDGSTFMASLSEVFSTAVKSTEPTVFTAEEIRLVAKHFEANNIEDIKIDEIDYKIPSDHHFYKKSKSTRIDRAGYFIIAARARSSIPMKIVFYCTALECLFSTSNTELNHKIAERVACLLGETSVNKIEIYTIVKKSYDIRSIVVHGSLIKGDDEEVIRIASELDNLLRLLFVKHSQFFEENEKELESIFVNLLFKD